jgi:ribonuclease J
MTTLVQYPFLLKEIPLTIYAHPLVRDFVNDKIEDFKDVNKATFKDIAAGVEFKVGNDFTFIPYRVNHSVPNTLGFFVLTPEVNVVHQSDFKFDFTPVMDSPADVREIASLSKEHKPLLMLSDSLGSTSSGFTETEMVIEQTFDNILGTSVGKQVIVTTISSNISRIQQAINSAKKFNRKVVISGRSIEQKVSVAVKHGLFTDEQIIISDTDAKSYKPGQLLYVVPGTYGQENAGLSKIADGRHKHIKLTENAVVVFSGDPIPGMEAPVDKLIDKLVLKGAKVIYAEIQEDTHVSGHGSQGDLALMANLVKPKYLCPIGGELKHMRAYKDLMVGSGFKAENVLELTDGQSIMVNSNEIKHDRVYELKEVYVDNNQTKALVENIVLRDRKMMSESGVVFVILPMVNGSIKSESPEIYTRGYILVKDNQSLLKGMRKNVTDTLNSLPGDAKKDITTIKKAVEKSINKHLYKRVGEVPIIVVETIDV